MIDGGMRLNPYRHDRRMEPICSGIKGLQVDFFPGKNIRSYDKSIMFGVTGQYFNLTTK